MEELGQSIVHTLVVVRDTVLEHENTGDIHFRDVCIEFQMSVNTSCCLYLLLIVNKGSCQVY